MRNQRGKIYSHLKTSNECVIFSAINFQNVRFKCSATSEMNSQMAYSVLTFSKFHLNERDYTNSVTLGTIALTSNTRQQYNIIRKCNFFTKKNEAERIFLFDRCKWMNEIPKRICVRAHTHTHTHTKIYIRREHRQTIQTFRFQFHVNHTVWTVWRHTCIHICMVYLPVKTITFTFIHSHTIYIIKSNDKRPNTMQKQKTSRERERKKREKKKR